MAPRAGKRRAQALPEWSRHPHLTQPSGLGGGRKWAQGRLEEGCPPRAREGGGSDGWSWCSPGRAGRPGKEVGGFRVCCGQAARQEVCAKP